jgi:hypothetical protein
MLFRTRLFAAATVVALMVVATFSVELRAMPRSPRRPALGGAPPILIDPDSSPHAILCMALIESGWDAESASKLAYRMMGEQLVDDDGLPLSPPSGAIAPIDPASKAITILCNALVESGYEAELASTIAYQMLGSTLGADGDPCYAYTYSAVYCDSAGNLRRHLGNINSLCWDGATAGSGLKACVSLACADGQVHWSSVKLISSCAGIPAGTCIQLSVLGSRTPLNCADIDLQCSCLAEATPAVDCSKIEHCCGTASGCDGHCPNCGN